MFTGRDNYELLNRLFKGREQPRFADKFMPGDNLQELINPSLPTHAAHYVLWSTLHRNNSHHLVLAYANPHVKDSSLSSGFEPVGSGADAESDDDDAEVADLRRVVKFYLPRDDFEFHSSEEIEEKIERLNIARHHRVVRQLPRYQAISFPHLSYRIVHYHRYGEHRGRHFLEMEFVNGQSFKQLQLAENGKLKYDRACDLISRAARALALLHGCEMVHRDVKPSNLMEDENGDVVVIDLDLVRKEPDSFGHQNETVTQNNRRVGTLAYMSPEYERYGHFDARSDQYSLGVTLYQLIGNQFPCAARVAGVQWDATPKPLPEIPHALWQIIVKMLSERPERRFDSMHEVADALDDIKSVLGRAWIRYRSKPEDYRQELIKAGQLVERQKLSNSLLAQKRRTTIAFCGPTGTQVSKLLAPVYERLSPLGRVACPVRITSRPIQHTQVTLRPGDATECRAILTAAYSYLHGQHNHLTDSSIKAGTEEFLLEYGSEYSKHFRSLGSFKVGLELANVIGLLNDSQTESDKLTATQRQCLSTAAGLPLTLAHKYARHILWQNDPKFRKLFKQASKNREPRKLTMNEFENLMAENPVSEMRSLAFAAELEFAFPSSAIRKVFGRPVQEFLARFDLLDLHGIHPATSTDNVNDALAKGYAKISGILATRRLSYDQLTVLANLGQTLSQPAADSLRKVIKSVELRSDLMKPVQVLCNCIASIKATLYGPDFDNFQNSLTYLEERLGVRRTHFLFTELRPYDVIGLKAIHYRKVRDYHDVLPQKAYETLMATVDNEPFYYLESNLVSLLANDDSESAASNWNQTVSDELDVLDTSSFVTGHPNHHALLLEWAKRLKKIRFGQQISLEFADVRSARSRCDATTVAILDLTHVNLNAVDQWPQWHHHDSEHRHSQATAFVERAIEHFVNQSLHSLARASTNLGYVDYEDLERVWRAYLSQTVLKHSAKEQLTRMLLSVERLGAERALRYLAMEMQNILLPDYLQVSHSSPAHMASDRAADSPSRQVIASFNRAVTAAALG